MIPSQASRLPVAFLLLGGNVPFNKCPCHAICNQAMNVICPLSCGSCPETAIQKRSRIGVSVRINTFSLEADSVWVARVCQRGSRTKSSPVSPKTDKPGLPSVSLVNQAALILPGAMKAPQRLLDCWADRRNAMDKMDNESCNSALPSLLRAYSDEAGAARRHGWLHATVIRYMCKKGQVCSQQWSPQLINGTVRKIIQALAIDAHSGRSPLQASSQRHTTIREQVGGACVGSRGRTQV